MTTYYVAPTGNNAFPGSEAQPWQTIAYGMSQLFPGDTLYLRAGLYTEHINSANVVQGTGPDDAILLAGYPDETITIAPNTGTAALVCTAAAWLIIDHLELAPVGLPGCLIDSASHDLIVRDCRISTPTNYGISSAGDRITCVNLTITNAIGSPGDGIILTGPTHTITGCLLSDNLGWGLRASGADHLLTLNRVRANGAGGIDCVSGAGAVLENNQVMRNGGVGIRIRAASSSVTVQHTTCTENVGSEILLDAGTFTPIVRNTIVFPADITDNGAVTPVLVGNLASDPFFVDSQGEDYHIRNISPARGAGVTLSATGTVDADDVARPYNGAWDIGAYQYQGRYFLSPGGNDAGVGNESDPWLTLAHAIPLLEPGATLYLMNGTYAETLSTATVAVPNGAAGYPITLTSAPGAVAVLTGASTILAFEDNSARMYLTFENLTFQMTSPGTSSTSGVFVGSTCHHIRFVGCTLTGGLTSVDGVPQTVATPAWTGAGISGGGSDLEVSGCVIQEWPAAGLLIQGQRWIIDNTTLRHNGGYGVALRHPSLSVVDSHVIRHNHITQNGWAFTGGLGAGVHIERGNSNIVYNNLIYDQRNGAAGIQVVVAGNTNRLYNNTCYANSGPGVALGTVIGTVVVNNILSFNSVAIQNTGDPSVVSQNNFTGDPLLVNPAQGDLRLSEASPVIGVGSNLSNYFTDDFAYGVRGVLWDIGGYQFEIETGPTPTIYTVAPSGDDGNNGITAPFRTVTHGLTVLQPGDTLELRQGTYAEALTNLIPSGTSWDLPITVRGALGETAILQPTTGAFVVSITQSIPAYIRLSALVLDGAGQTVGALDLRGDSLPSGPRDIEVLDCTVRNCRGGVLLGNATRVTWRGGTITTCSAGDGAGHGLTIGAGCSSLTVEDVTITQNAGAGIAILGTDSSISGIILQRNRIGQNGTAGGTWGIMVHGASGTQVLNNLLYASDGGGLGGGLSIGAGGSPTLNTVVYHNTILDHVVGEAGIRIGTLANGTVIRNSIIWNNTVDLLDMGLNTAQSFNWLTAQGNPNFVDLVTYDLHLTTASGPWNTGTNLSGLVLTDFDGNPRPIGGGWDIGAYELNAPGQGTVWYVSPSGSDTNTGNTPSAPFATIEHALGVVLPGDTVALRAGSYPESIDATAYGIPSGTPAAPIVLTRYLAEVATLTGSGPILVHLADNVANASYLTFRNLRFDATAWPGGTGLRIGTGSHHITLEGCEVTGTGSGGRGVRTSTGSVAVTLTDCWIHANGRYGLDIRGDQNVIEQCLIEATTEYGMQLFGGSGSIVRRCRFFTNGTGTVADEGAIWVGPGNGHRIENCLVASNYNGLVVAGASTNVGVYNTTVYGSTQYGLWIVDTAVLDMLMTNTILYASGTANLQNNGVPGELTQTTNLVGTNPLVVNAATRDFHLRTASPAANTGTNLSSLFTVDFAGQTRAVPWDIGAYDSVTAAQPIPLVVRATLPPGAVRNGTTTAHPTPALVTARTATVAAFLRVPGTATLHPSTVQVRSVVPTATLRRTTYYVALTGSDSQNGQLSTPWRTLAYAVPRLLPGDTLLLREGVYLEGLRPEVMTIPSGVSWDLPVTIASYPGEQGTIETVTLTSNLANVSYLVLDGLIIDTRSLGTAGVYVGTGSHHITVQACAIRNGYGVVDTGIGIETVTGADDNRFLQTTVSDFGLNIWLRSARNTVTGCVSLRAWREGLLLAHTSTTVTLNRVSSTVITGCGRAPGTWCGVLVGSGDDNSIINTLVYENTGYGIQVSGGTAARTLIYHNTVVANTLSGVRIAAGVINTLVRNNLLSGNGADAVQNSGTSSVITPNYVGTAPVFVDAAGDDYHLRMESPARDTAVTLTAVPTDFDGNTRPQGTAPDAGAYEVVFLGLQPRTLGATVRLNTVGIRRTGTILQRPDPVLIRTQIQRSTSRPTFRPRAVGVQTRLITPASVTMGARGGELAPLRVEIRMPLPRVSTGRGQRVLSPALAAKFAQSYLKADWLLEIPSLQMKVSYTYDPDGTWTHQYASIGEVEMSVPIGGGLAAISDLQVQLYEDTTPYGATALAMRWHIGSTTTSRAVRLSLLVEGETEPYQMFHGSIYRLQHRDGMLTLWATDDSLHANRQLPSRLVTRQEYPDAADTAVNKALPLLYGTGAIVGAAPLLYVDIRQFVYAVSHHEMVTLGLEYATLDSSTRTLQYRTGDATFQASTSPTTLRLATGTQGLRFNLIPASQSISRQLGVTNGAAVFDGSPTTLATITTPSLELSTLNGIGHLGVLGVFPVARGTNTLLVSATQHRRLLGGAPTTTGQFIVRTLDATGTIIRPDLFRSPEFRHSLAPRDHTFTITSLQLADNERLETLILATNEGSVGGPLEAYSIGELTMTLVHQPSGDEDLFLGRQWQGRVDPTGAVTGNAGTLLTAPSDITGSLLVSELGQTLASGTWQTTRQHYLAEGWAFAGGLGAGWFHEQTDARNVLQDIARQSAGLLSLDFAGEWRHVALGTLTIPAAHITQQDILYTGEPQTPPGQRASSLELALWDLDGVYTHYEIRYKYNPATRAFGATRFVGPGGTNIPGPGAAGLDLLGLCINSARRYGELPPLIVDAWLIYDDTTAENLLRHLVYTFWSQRLKVSFETPLGRAAHLLLGDNITVTHPSFPIADQGQRFDVHGLRFLPSSGRIRVSASRLMAVVYDVVTLLGPASTVWYLWVNSAGEITRETVTPTIPGLDARLLTPTLPPPSWWAVVDETQSPWMLYLNTEGELVLDRTPPGTGYGSAGLGAGMQLRGANSVLYRLGIRSWGEWVLEELEI